MWVAVIGVVGAIVAAAVGAVIAAWATLRARRKQDGVISVFDVTVMDAETVLAERDADAHVLGELVPERPVLDIVVRNGGDLDGVVRRVQVDVEGLLHIPPIDLPFVLVLPGATITEPLPAQQRSMGPSAAYAANFPLREGSYRHSVNQLIPAGTADRFVVSLVAAEAERGRDFYGVSLTLDCGRSKKGRATTAWESVRVLAYGPPAWESPDEIRERLSRMADRVRELAPSGGDSVGVLFNSTVHPARTAMDDYVTVYENKLKVLAAALGECQKYAADETRIRTWLTELERATEEIEPLRHHATALRASGGHP
ncbi:hypothetical protein [Streptomyces sp. NBC_01361]|uniref:hypothetical protein n=1 Tax=Streptomyces sp. NBC_01361 TaxID=2903838 RepID=UPI002E34DC91|nr:hypothetical protein [Streptomyces sp. NBC_01361]